MIETDYKDRKSRVIKRDNITGEYFDLREVMKDNYNEEQMDIVIDGNNINDEMIEKIVGELR